MSQDLSDVTVRARKLSLENLLDSVIQHAPKSYVEPQLYAVTERTLLYKPGDTLFRADIPAYFVKGKDFSYRLRRDTTEKVLVEDRLPADAHQRVMNFSAFPELTNLLTFLESVASASVSQRGFYATSGWGDSLRYHVIVPQKFKRTFMTKMFTAKMDEDTILGFSHYTIRRKGWVLEESGWKYNHGTARVGAAVPEKHLVSRGGFADGRRAGAGAGSKGFWYLEMGGRPGWPVFFQ